MKIFCTFTDYAALRDGRRFHLSKHNGASMRDSTRTIEFDFEFQYPRAGQQDLAT